MVAKHRKILMAFLLFATLLSLQEAEASFQVLSWNLSSGLSDSTPPSTQSGQFNTTVTNPYAGVLQGHLGLNSCTSTHDYSWLFTEPSATFNTSMVQGLRSPRIRAVSTAFIRFQTTVETQFHLNSLISYTHTPGDENLVDWDIRLFNETAGFNHINVAFNGGHGHFEPSSGTFAFTQTVTLPANSSFAFSYVLDGTNVTDPLPTGIMDIAGYVNWTLTPEPSSLALLAIAFPFILRPRRR